MWKKVQINKDRTKEILKKRIISEGIYYYVFRIKETNEPIAYAVKMEFYDAVAERNNSFYRDFYVIEKVRGLGLYSIGFQHASSDSLESGHINIKMYVREQNPALNIYKKHGADVYDLDLL